MDGVEGSFVKCQLLENDDQSQQFYKKILPFESYNCIKETKDRFCCIEFQRQQCISLELFMKAIELKYLRVYNGQIALVARKIIIHFKKLQLYNFSHGNISKNNIIIELDKNSQRFTTYARPVQIKNIYFTNYDRSTQRNDEQEMSNIISSLLDLIIITEENQKNKTCDFFNKKLYQKQSVLPTLSILERDEFKTQKWAMINNDEEDPYRSTRYISCNTYAKDLTQVQDKLVEFRNKIAKSLQTDDQQFQDNVQWIQKPQDILDKGEEEIVIITGESNSQKVNSTYYHFNNFLKELFIQNIYEQSIEWRFKAIGEYLSSQNSIIKYEETKYDDAININFKTQELSFISLLQQCQKLRESFFSIYKDIDDKRQQIFKIDIKLSFESSLTFLFDKLYYFILSEEKLKKENILLDHTFEDFQKQWNTEIRTVVQEIYNEYFSLELLQFIISLV